MPAARALKADSVEEGIERPQALVHDTLRQCCMLLQNSIMLQRNANLAWCMCVREKCHTQLPTHSSIHPLFRIYPFKSPGLA